MTKQDQMIELMRNQQNILRNMFRARDSLRIIDHELASDTTSIRTSRTNRSVLTAFEFDSIIKRTAIYQRYTWMSGHYPALPPLKGIDGRVSFRAQSGVHDHETTPELTFVPISRQEAEPPNVSLHERMPMTTAVTPSHVPTPRSDSNTTSIDSKVSMRSSRVKMTTAPPSGSLLDRQCPSIIIRPRPKDFKSSTEACVTPDPNYVKLWAEDLVPDTAPVGNMPACDESGTVNSTLIAAPLSRGQGIETIYTDNRKTSEKLLYDHKSKVISVAVSSNYVLASASLDTIRLWDLSTGKELTKIPCTCDAVAYPGLTFSLDGKMLASAHDELENPNSAVSVWDPQTGELIRALIPQSDQSSRERVSAIAYSGSNNFIACDLVLHTSSINVGSRIGLYHVHTGQLYRTFTHFGAPLRLLSFFETQLIFIYDDMKTEVLDPVTSRSQIGRLVRKHRCINLTYDGTIVVSEGPKKIAMTSTKVATGTRTRVSDTVFCLACSPGANRDSVCRSWWLSRHMEPTD